MPLRRATRLSKTRLLRSEGIERTAPKKTVRKKIGVSSMSKLKKQLDTVFSLYIRTRDKGQCYTCPNSNEIKKMQNGHFIPRQYLSVRWDETNNHCQCYACNMLYNGQPGAYAIRLEKDYGVGTVAALEARRKDVVRMKPDDYTAKIAEYTAKTAQLGRP